MLLLLLGLGLVDGDEARTVEVEEWRAVGRLASSRSESAEDSAGDEVVRWG